MFWRYKPLSRWAREKLQMDTSDLPRSSLPYSKYESINPDGNDFKAMAKRCTMGDLKAMIWMFSELRRHLPKDYFAEEEVHINSDEDLQTQIKWLDDYMDRHMDFEIYHRITGACMWLQRAAVYGSEHAKKLLEKYPLYKAAAYLPENIHCHGKSSLPLHCPGKALRLMGLLDFTDDAEYSVPTMNKNNIYMCYYVADWDSPDDDGFGSENYFNEYYFDQFFRLMFRMDMWTSYQRYDVKDKVEAICLERQKELQQEREEFWAERADRVDMERYKDIPSFEEARAKL